MGPGCTIGGRMWAMVNSQRNVAWWSLAVIATLLVGGWFVLENQEGEAAPSKAPPTRRAILAESWRQLSAGGIQEGRDSQIQDWSRFAKLWRKPAMPLQMRRAVSETLGPAQSLDLRFDQARYATAPVGGGLWVVPGRGVMCLFRAKTATSTCNTAAIAERRGILLEVFRPGSSPGRRPTHFLALGIAPNWARRVEVNVDRELKTIPIVNNTYGLRANVPIRFRRLTQ
jgi:hypothetical protein